MTTIHDLIQRGAIIYSNPGGKQSPPTLFVWEGSSLTAWVDHKESGWLPAGEQGLVIDISEANGDNVLEAVISEAEEFFMDLLTLGLEAA
jgi:hypothetical protein